MSNLTEIRTVVAKFFHADGQTHRHVDITKLIVAFCNFADAPKNAVYCYDSATTYQFTFYLYFDSVTVHTHRIQAHCFFKSSFLGCVILRF
jgi:hypothetical protein